MSEIPLPAAPLIAVLAQIKFPSVASIAKEQFIGPFQEQIRQSYPVLRQDQEVNIVVTPEGVNAAGESTPIWRFFDRSDDPEWKVSLASSIRSARHFPIREPRRLSWATPKGSRSAHRHYRTVYVRSPRRAVRQPNPARAHRRLGHSRTPRSARYDNCRPRSGRQSCPQPRGRRVQGAKCSTSRRDGA